MRKISRNTDVSLRKLRGSIALKDFKFHKFMQWEFAGFGAGSMVKYRL